MQRRREKVWKKNMQLDRRKRMVLIATCSGWMTFNIMLWGRMTWAMNINNISWGQASEIISGSHLWNLSRSKSQSPCVIASDWFQSFWIGPPSDWSTVKHIFFYTWSIWRWVQPRRSNIWWAQSDEFSEKNNAYRTIQTIKIGPLNVDNQLFEFWMIYLMGMDQTALIMCFD